jgi:hypothetical protein
MCESVGIHNSDLRAWLPRSPQKVAAWFMGDDAMTKQGQGCLGENVYRLGTWRKEPVHPKRRFCIIHMKVPWIQVSSPSDPQRRY